MIVVIIVGSHEVSDQIWECVHYICVCVAVITKYGFYGLWLNNDFTHLHN